VFRISKQTILIKPDSINLVLKILVQIWLNLEMMADGKGEFLDLDADSLV
jgi:hypothetical protein